MSGPRARAGGCQAVLVVKFRRDRVFQGLPCMEGESESLTQRQKKRKFDTAFCWAIFLFFLLLVLVFGIVMIILEST